MGSFTNAVNLWFEFFADAFTSAVEFLAKLPQMLAFVHELFALVPAEIRAFALLSVSLSVLLMFISFIRTDTTGG